MIPHGVARVNGRKSRPEDGHSIASQLTFDCLHG
jgi:hypothetical protein